MIKVIVFDFAGVLTKEAHFKPFCDKYSPIYNIDPEKFHNTIKNIGIKQRSTELNQFYFGKIFQRN